MTRKKEDDIYSHNETLERVTTRRVRWQHTHRLIPTRYPPISLFERIANKNDWDALYALEGLTDPRLREEVGEISSVPKSRRVTGPGASVTMAPFSHFSKGRPTRFSDGTYGVYYAAREFQTALWEVAFHMARFHARTNDPALAVSYREYVGKIDKVMHDLTKGDWSAFFNPSVVHYPESQALAKSLREHSSNGIVYPSVRNRRGQCIAAFYPDVVKIPIQGRHVELHWDGTNVDKWFDYETESWNTLMISP